MAMVGIAVDRKERVFVHDGGGSKGRHASNPKVEWGVTWIRLHFYALGKFNGNANKLWSGVLSVTAEHIDITSGRAVGNKMVHVVSRATQNTSILYTALRVAGIRREFFFYFWYHLSRLYTTMFTVAV